MQVYGQMEKRPMYSSSYIPTGEQMK